MGCKICSCPWPVVLQTSLLIKYVYRFRWVACQVDMLGKSLNRAKLRQALRNLPKTLGATYERILSAIDEDFRDHALTILRWLAFSPRPLYAEEAAEIVAISSEDAIPTFDKDQILLDPSDILTICPSLVTVTSLPAIGPAPMDLAQKGAVYGRRAFTLAHYSVKEYLLSDLIHNSPAAGFSIQDATSQAFIAKSCLGYMLQFRKLESVTWQTFDEFHLLDYVARFWPHHARAAGIVRLSLQPLALELMSLEDDAYLNWCRVYDVDGDTASPAHWTSVDQIASPLYTASAFGLTDIVERLLFERGFEVNQRSRVHGTPLQAASFHGFDETVQFLLANGADPNIYQRNKPSALQLASASGHLKVVEHLIRAGIHIDALSDKYGTALQAASSNGHTEIVRTLIANRADVNAQGGTYGTALIAALGAEHHTIVYLLLDAGANIHINSGVLDSTLQAAAYAGDNKLIQELLDTGAEVNRQGGTYETALQAAAFNGHLQTVEILLEAKADVNILGGEYGSALQAASTKNHVEIVRRLLGAGADVNAEIGWDVTALHASISGGSSLDIIELLLSAGADYGFVHKSFGTPLHNAAMFGRLSVTERLLKAGAEVNAQHSDLGGAVQVAAWHAKEKVVELLLAHGADISFEGPNKSTVRQQALYFGWKLKSLSEYEESEAEGTWRCDTKQLHESSVSIR
jgi:ankyrin repeat protein